ncbi:Chk1 protein kinase [Rhizophlyctis rosea]|nr:Chk1 protein kinase [Rhizophlyctis rosea]
MLASQQVVCGYELRETIGQGASAKVKLGIHPQTGEVVAVKIVRKRSGKEGQAVVTALQKEIKIHASVEHENIIKLMGAIDDDFHIYIVMEYAAAGELFDRIEPDVGVEEDLAHMYFQQLMNGVEFLHGRGIAHRDLKPENLLLDSNGNLKISDFGLATVYAIDGKRRVLKTPCGTPPYVAPEIHSMHYFGDIVDIWSAGVILFALCAGNTPWGEPTQHDPEFVEYRKHYPQPNLPPWTIFPQPILDILTGMMNPDANRRFTIKMIRESPWFRRANLLLTDGRCNDPARVAEKMMSQMGMDLDTPPMAYSQPTDMRADNYSPNMENATLEDRHNVSFSQPVGMVMADSATQNTSPALIRGGFIDIFRSEWITRFYSYADSSELAHQIHGIFEDFLVPWKHHGQMMISFTTVDKRKCPLHGEVSILPIPKGPHMVHFRKSKGDPMEFKRFYKAVKAALGDLVAS